VARGFQIQAQWALVAIPAPIYILGRIDWVRTYRQAHNHLFTAPYYTINMGVQRSFGKLGNRATARLMTGLDATVLFPGRTAKVQLENISRKGCRLHLAEPPRLGVTAVVKVDRTEALGTVAWVRGLRCGVRFDSMLSLQEVERIRWIVDHAQDHEKTKLSSAAAVWR
jgi:hypothetical protein